MRTLMERSQGRDLVLVDGVKVLEDDGWALVLPDPEEPLTHVWAEAPERGPGRGAGPASTPPGSSTSSSDRRAVAAATGGGGIVGSGRVGRHERA